MSISRQETYLWSLENTNVFHNHITRTQNIADGLICLQDKIQKGMQNYIPLVRLWKAFFLSPRVSCKKQELVTHLGFSMWSELSYSFVVSVLCCVVSFVFCNLSSALSICWLPLRFPPTFISKGDSQQCNLNISFVYDGCRWLDNYLKFINRLFRRKANTLCFHKHLNIKYNCT